MTHAQEQELCRLVSWRLRGWRQHPDWEDIYSEGLLLAWRSYSGSEGKPHERRIAMATGAARYAYNQWCRRWYGQVGNSRVNCEVQRERPEVSLDMLAEAKIRSFEPRLLNRLEGQWLWKRVAAICTAREQQIIEALVLKGETQRAAAARLGITRGGLDATYREGVRKCRERLR